MLPDQTHISQVAISVSDLARSLDFYQNVLGFRLHRQAEKTAYLGAGEGDLLILQEDAKALPVQYDRGMYHFAVLLPNRVALAQLLYHFIQTKTSLQGMSDHLVSEAIYLADPDGHGIEVYADRPRDTWQYVANGQVTMSTEALDYQDLLDELNEENSAWEGLPPKTTIGHMHIFVDNMMTGESFYREVMGWQLMTRYSWAMAFLAAGGYHHHMGVRLGRGKTDSSRLSLQWYGVALPDETSRQAVVTRLQEHGISTQTRPDGIYFQDPANNGILLTIDN